MVVSCLGLLSLVLAVPGCSLAFLALAYPWMLCAYQAALGCFQAAFCYLFLSGLVRADGLMYTRAAPSSRGICEETHTHETTKRQQSGNHHPNLAWDSSFRRDVTPSRPRKPQKPNAQFYTKTVYPETAKNKHVFFSYLPCPGTRVPNESRLPWHEAVV